jgi:ABC-type oligopeptide transport system ATPase subunit
MLLNDRGFQTIAEQTRNLREYSANPAQRIRTGFESLDLLVEGPAPGEVFTIIGRSYSGKSLVATEIMRNNPKKGSIFFSLEMPYRQALMRLYSQWADLNADTVRFQIKHNTLSSNLEEMAQELDRHVIIDRSGLNTTDMTLLIEAYQDWYEKKPDFILIDYLERVAGVKSGADGWQGVEAQADMIKDLAKSLDIPVFLFHQTNRSEDAWVPPTDRSARGGGFTEADFVVGMWQPASDPALTIHERQALWNTVRMTVLKNRYSGEQNMPWKPLEFERTDSLRFVDLAIQAEKVQTYAQYQDQIAAAARLLGEQTTIEMPE